jgi:hypothetical protein
LQPCTTGGRDNAGLSAIGEGGGVRSPIGRLSFLGEGCIEVQHERVGINAKLGSRNPVVGDGGRHRRAPSTMNILDGYPVAERRDATCLSATAPAALLKNAFLRHCGELWWNLGDGADQAARWSAFAISATPSVNLTPAMTMGKQFHPSAVARSSMPPWQA